MSQLFDTLRRGSRTPRPGRSGAAGGTAHADAVLATLGFRSRSARSVSRVLVAVLGITALVGVWYAWQWYAQPVVRRVSSTVRQDTGRDVPPKKPAPAPPVESPTSPDTAVGTTTQTQPVVPVLRAKTPAPGAVADVEQAVLRPEPATPPQESSFSNALRAQQAGDTTRAVQLYRELLQHDSRNAFAHNNLGLLYQQQGDLAAAAREFELALEADGRYLKARNNLGVAWLAQGRADQAATHFRAVLAVNPRDVDALVNLALTDRAAGRLEVAKETLLRALVLEPANPAAHYNLAVLYEQSAEPGRAIAHYRAFLDHAGPEHDDRAGDVRARLDLLLQRSAGS